MCQLNRSLPAESRLADLLKGYYDTCAFLYSSFKVCTRRLGLIVRFVTDFGDVDISLSLGLCLMTHVQ